MPSVAIVIGSIMQETNTFSPMPTTLQTFAADYVYYGDEVLRRMRGTRTETGGFLDVLAQAGKEAVPTLVAHSVSSGTVTLETHLTLQQELLRRLAEVEHPEAVLLSFHGAMAADGCDDTEGDTLRKVRELVGPAVPIAVSLDLHAHVTEQMVAAADLIVGYHTFPHVDLYETGRKAARLLLRTLAGELRPVMVRQHVPMHVSPENQVTSAGPMAELVARCREWEARPGVLAVTAFTVQPWLDVPGTGFVALTVADGDSEPGRAAATDVARLAWRLRNDFEPERVEPREAVRRAAAVSGGPLVLAETADSPSAGAPGDSAALVRAILAEGATVPAMVTVVDPEAVAAAISAGVGATVRIPVGHKLDPRWGEPVQVEGRVRLLSDGRFVYKGYTGVEGNMGRAAVIQAGELALVVCEQAFYHIDPSSYRSLGLEPREAKIVGVKSTTQFRDCYEPLAAAVQLLDTTGCSSGRLRNLPFRRVTRPLWPLDEFEWQG